MSTEEKEDVAKKADEARKEIKAWQRRLNAPEWAKKYRLDSVDDVKRFLKEVIKFTFTGQLGTRQASAINGSCKLLIMAMTATEGKKRVSTIATEKKWNDFLDELSIDEKDRLLDEAKRRSMGKVKNPEQSFSSSGVKISEAPLAELASQTDHGNSDERTSGSPIDA